MAREITITITETQGELSRTIEAHKPAESDKFEITHSGDDNAIDVHGAVYYDWPENNDVPVVTAGSYLVDV